MRIALLSNFWYRRGGLEAVMLQDAAALTERGHEVAPFASAHELNEPSAFAEFFPRSVNHAELGQGLGVRGRVREAGRLLSNADAVRAFERFRAAFSPDVVHQHGTSRQLSPSVLMAAKQAGLPVVLSLHDYSLRCPAAILSRTGVPECLEVSCAGHRYDRAVRFKCVHGSRTASAVAAAELLFNRALRRYERAVDLFLVPSKYAAARLGETGIPADRVRVMTNAVEPTRDDRAGPGAGFLALGRLERYKGFDKVIAVARSMTETAFAIAGAGPDEARLRELAVSVPNVDLVGHVRPAELALMIRAARAVIVPSRVPETFGMVVLEAWREGTPVIVTDIGALSELVDDGETGRVVGVDDDAALAAAVDALQNAPEVAVAMGARGRELVGGRYGLSAHVTRLEQVYAELADSA